MLKISHVLDKIEMLDKEAGSLSSFLTKDTEGSFTKWISLFSNKPESLQALKFKLAKLPDSLLQYNHYTIQNQPLMYDEDLGFLKDFISKLGGVGHISLSLNPDDPVMSFDSDTITLNPFIFPKDPMSLSKLAQKAKYKNKKTVKNKDGDDMIIYEYSDRQIQNRHKEKADRIEKLRHSLGDLRKQVKKDLNSKDIKTKQTALAIALMDATFERVGNEQSAKEGHFGVTGWQVEHLSFEGGKAHFKYVGKSGVKQHKIVEDKNLISILKEIKKQSKKGDLICSNGDCKITSSDVNSYLEPFDITAKDIRGLHANEEMKVQLDLVRTEGSELPFARKEKDKILKEEFKKALEATAKVVGHEPATLRNQYLVPSLEDLYMKDGTVIDKLNHKKATKTKEEKFQEESERLVRPMPKYKPPRKDLQRNRIKEEDPDTKPMGAENDRDLSKNYKRVAKETDKKSEKTTKPVKPSNNNKERLWQTEKGNWGARRKPTDAVTYFNKKEEAEAFLKGEEAKPEELKNNPIYLKEMQNKLVAGTSITFGELRKTPRGTFLYDPKTDKYVLRGLSDGYTIGMSKKQLLKDIHGFLASGEINQKTYEETVSKLRKQEEKEKLENDDTAEMESLKDDTGELKGIETDDTSEIESLEDGTEQTEGLEEEEEEEEEGLTEEDLEPVEEEKEPSTVQIPEVPEDTKKNPKDDSKTQPMPPVDPGATQPVQAPQTPPQAPPQAPTGPQAPQPDPNQTQPIQAPLNGPQAPQAPTQPQETEEQKKEREVQEKKQKDKKSKRQGQEWEDPFDPSKMAYWPLGAQEPEYGLSAKEVLKRKNQDIDEQRAKDELSKTKGDVWFDDMTKTWAVWDTSKNKPTWGLNEVDKNKMVLSMERQKELQQRSPGDVWQEKSGKWAVWVEGDKEPTYDFKDEKEVRDLLKGKEDSSGSGSGNTDTKNKGKGPSNTSPNKGKGQDQGGKKENPEHLTDEEMDYYFDPQSSLKTSLKQVTKHMSEGNKKVWKKPYKVSGGVALPSAEQMSVLRETLDGMDYSQLSKWVEDLPRDDKFFPKDNYKLYLDSMASSGLSSEDQIELAEYFKDKVLFDVTYGCAMAAFNKIKAEPEIDKGKKTYFESIQKQLRDGNITNDEYKKRWKEHLDTENNNKIRALEDAADQAEDEGNDFLARQMRLQAENMKKGTPQSTLKQVDGNLDLPNVDEIEFEEIDFMPSFLKQLDKDEIPKDIKNIKPVSKKLKDLNYKHKGGWDSIPPERQEAVKKMFQDKKMVKPTLISWSGDEYTTQTTSDILAYAEKHLLDVDVDYLEFNQEIYETENGKWAVNYQDQKVYFDTKEDAEDYLDRLKNPSGSQPKNAFLLFYNKTSKSDPLKHSGRNKMNIRLAKKIVATLDHLADLMEQHHEELGFPQKVAFDFAHKCDCVADKLERTANFDPNQIGKKNNGPLVKDSDESFLNDHFTQGNFHQLEEDYESGKLEPKSVKQAARNMRSWFDPSSIGKEVGGPLVHDADEEYMRGEFSMQERRELRTRQESGDMPFVDERPDAPKPGRSAKRR